MMNNNENMNIDRYTKNVDFSTYKYKDSTGFDGKHRDSKLPTLCTA